MAVIHDRFGDVGVLELRTVPDEPLTPTQVRITVTVAGLNPVDWQIVESAGLAALFGITAPSGYGNDFAGVIAETGSAVTQWKAGDRVFGGARGKALATSVVLEEDHRSLRRTPDAIDDLTAGVLDIAGRMASAVADAIAAQPDETVLVSAAAGGVGSILTQLLTRAGVRVIGTGSAASFEFIRSLGAEPVAYGPNLERDLTDLDAASIVAAADLFSIETARTALALGVEPGRIITIESDDPPAGVRAVNGSQARPDALPALMELIAAGEIRVPIAATYDLTRFAEAVAFQRDRHAHGKVAIEITPV